MDWVDFKRTVIRYRPPYKDIHTHVDKLIISAVGCYAKYRRMSIEGCIEYEVIRQYGIFLYYIAEIESLTAGIRPDKAKKTEYDWGLIETGMRIIGDRKEHRCNDSELLIRASGWVRRIYPMIATERVFYDAMCDNRLLMIEKHHY